MGSPRKLRNCETKSLERRNVIPLLFPSFFSIAEIFWQTEVFPHEFFWSCQTTKLRQIVIPLFSNFFSDTRAFLKHKGSHYETFLYSGTEKVSPENRGTPLSYPKFLSFPWKFWNTEGSPTKTFGTLRLKTFDGKSWYSPIKHNSFDTRNFLKNRKVPLQIFSALWEKKFPSQKRDNPPLFYNFFLSRTFGKNRRVPTWSFLALWD